MKNLTPREKDVLQYMEKIERMNFVKSGSFGIYPNVWQISQVFGFSRQRAYQILKKLEEALDKNLKQTSKQDEC